MSNKVDETKPTPQGGGPPEQAAQEEQQEVERAAHIARIAAKLMQSHDETFKELAK